jgi:restriction system protein
MINDDVCSPLAWKLRCEYKSLHKVSSKSYEAVIHYPVKNIKFEYSRTQIESQIRSAYADSSEKRIKAHTGQIFAALNKVKPKDLVIIPTNKGKFFTIGVIEKLPEISLEGSIKFQFLMKRKDIPLSLFDQDLRYSFMAIMKLCEVKRNNAAQRLMSISNGADDPGFL